MKNLHCVNLALSALTLQQFARLRVAMQSGSKAEYLQQSRKQQKALSFVEVASELDRELNVLHWK